jgi:predicted phage terminase large subunit-like protein
MIMAPPLIHPGDAERLALAMIGTDFYSFVQASFPIVSGGGRLRSNWHIEAMAHELIEVMRGKTRRLIITVPPRSLKSICASVCLPAFALGHQPSRRLICVSYSEALARKHANDCRALMRSRMYQVVFPATRISPAKDTETEVMTTARGSRLATSVGGTLTGRGGDLLIIDDPLKPQDAQSESARESLKDWYANTLLSRLDDKVEGSIIIVMQRLHPDDLVGHLLDQGGWKHLNLPAIAEEEMIVSLSTTRRHRRRVGDLLHPARESQVALEELKAAMGSMEFAAQYQQAPVPIGGNLIKRSWFKLYDPAPVPQPSDRLIVSWDTALSSRELADYSACVVLLVRKNTVYVLDVVRARLEYPELKRVVLQNHQRWRNAGCWSYELLIERKGSGLSLIQDLQREGFHPIGVQPEGDKVMRMAAQSAWIEAGAVHLPARAAWLDEFMKEVLSFPASKHDDQIDALSQGLQRAFAPPPPQAAFGRY